ncbi:alpha/beta-glucosidase agdC [Penicillium macrosclerotiorum]|uniref:alpha/beta-glucosidase agdC n=1 Tax=Penicillium macrosclerotiorum TaxID=303699 RepID=UPI002546A0E6|nr:alpha/beta-glucosidase agdC [Penicillium macrosclerotiorum]KAJ5682906.1 alpha/beta-glucosidase agdC [Penicillium macrosclerotiorum]
MWGVLLFLAPLAGAAALSPRSSLEDCPGYKALNIKEHGQSLTADLVLAGDPCNSYGTDLDNLKLLVEYQTDDRLHIIIYDADEEVYQVPESVLPRPNAHGHHNKGDSTLRFDYQPEPFSFRVLRDEEVLFDTSETNLIFQSQYLNLRTWLPNDPYLYGLGEHTDSLRLPISNYTRTLWSRDAYGVPENTNLYGNHPVYVDHRGDAGTHGVFFLNSNGMDIKIDKTDDGRQFLEYNTIGGVLDFYFMAGPTPKEVSKQYSEIVGLPAMQSYWAFGYHNCRYGYRDVYDVAEAVYNYSQARIPLETMWTDIDYMDGRRVFTLDPQRFPLDKMRELVTYLHKHNQHYIVMVDPAVSKSDNGAFNRGNDDGVFLYRDDETLYEGAVWPGVTVYPDWFNPDTQDYWNGEFSRFFSRRDGVDIDGLWIDMNEAANFCPWPCSDPAAYSEENDLPPDPPAVRSPPRSLPGFPADFQPSKLSSTKRSDSAGKVRRDTKGKKAGLPGRDLIAPPYQIANAAGSLSNKTIDTDLIHAGTGYAEYDTHNLYGTMMSSASREAMLQRRPNVRPLVITRSTFAGAGAHVGHWLGDNLSQWDKYRISISQMLAFASIFQIPMVGSDVCGFGGNTTEELCARWATLGAFNPFYRNHNGIDSIPQEFYRWPTVAEAARKIIDIRYRLLDYLYTAFYRQTQTGEPFLQPLFYVYPQDPNTFANELQFFYGDALLVSPVPDEGQTTVSAYFPNDIFYEWHTGAVVRGRGATITIPDVGLTDIPLHIRGGSVLPLRASSAMTTTELRRRGFEILIAPNLSGYATGELYLDDGEALEPSSSLLATFVYEHGTLTIRGHFGFHPNVVIQSVTVLGQQQHHPGRAMRRGVEYDAARGSVTKKVNIALTGPAVVDIL